MRRIAFISHSGGLDSTTILYRLLHEGTFVYTINFDYGQNNDIEVQTQNRIIDNIKSNEKISKYFKGNLKLDITSITNALAQVKTMQGVNGEIKDNTGHEYYFPFRNLVFASLTSMLAESLILELKKDPDELFEVCIVLGIHKHTDIYSKQYWDVTPEFSKALDAILHLNSDFKNCEFKIFAPYENEYKSAIVDDVVKYNVPWELTTTCYNPQRRGINYIPCKECEACLERENGAKESQIWLSKYSTSLKINEYIIS